MIEQMEDYARFCKLAQIVHPSFIDWRASFQDWLEDVELQALYNETEGN